MAISLADIQGLLLPGLEMCASKGSIPVITQTQAEQLAAYRRLAALQSTQSGLAESYAFARQAIADNLFKQEFVPSPPVEVTARELTKEELRARVERKLDLDEAKITTAAEMVSHGRWRRIVDEVFKEDGNKGGDDAERTQEGGNGGRKRGNGGGGDDAG
jgi:hypothetical protein